MIPRHLLRSSSGVVRVSSSDAPLHMRASGVLLAIGRRHGIATGSHRRTSCSIKRRFYHEDAHERLRNAKPLVPNTVASRLSRAGSSRNSRAVVIASVVAAVAFYLYNSQTSPVTGRRRFNFLSDALVAQAYSRAAEAIVRQVEEQGGHFLSNWDPRTMLVQRVMKRLIPVSGMEDLDWEVRVIADSRTANAFVIPGGKVFVHSGILNVCRSEDALAAVLGHEIAHNTASHAAERLSAAWVGNLTAGSLFFLAGALPGLALFGLWNVIGGYYLQDLLFYLPMGRKQESEADYIGLMMMAEACYDPRQAVGFWQRMETIQRMGGHEVPEMLSTHPSNEHRIKKIEEWLPEAMKKRMESDCRTTTAYADRFREALRRRRPVVVEI
ncbi:hypothetical protein MKX07_001654 [Trichoderma sp. CBMAI-0711]|nr:hypothetical protein MKX07_001654 [Trichoderma sp. CBMAI-0711]